MYFMKGENTFAHFFVTHFQFHPVTEDVHHEQQNYSAGIDLSTRKEGSVNN